MKSCENIYDKNGIKIEFGDIIFDGYDKNTLEPYYGEIYIAGTKSIWRIENFSLDTFKDGYKLNDFEKCIDTL